MAKHSSGVYICDWCGDDYNLDQSDSTMLRQYCSLWCELRTAEERDFNCGRDKDEWRHVAAEQQRLK